MNKLQIRKLLVFVALLASAFSSFALPEIVCIADGSGGEYCGDGYGITVNVSTPLSGYTIKYAESETGPWVDELKYVNVCTDKPIYYQVTATGYTTKVGSAPVTVTPKELTNDMIWLVLPPEDYVYDGDKKKPEVAFGDGDPSIMTESDFDVSYSDNVNAGTATATFTGKGNYTGFCTEDFEILKADNEWTTEPAIANWTYGQPASTPVSAAKVGTATVTYSSGSVPTMPGDYQAAFTVAESDNYNELTETVDFKVLPATISCVADGSSGEYCGTGYGITVNVSTPASGYTVKYSENATGPWVDEVKFVNVCTGKPIWYRVTAPDYVTKTGSATVTITPKLLTEDFVWGVYPTKDYVYDGTEKRPDVAFGDGYPSILSENDFTVTYVDNVNAGENSARIVFTGRGNYKGVVEEPFSIRKIVVGVPTIASKIYTGELLKADVPTSSEYTVIGNNGGVAAATYSFMLRLTDAVNTKWATTDDELVEVSFTIAKATIDVSGVAWDYTAPFAYDGAAHSVLITGLPDGVTVKSYSNNTASSAGKYHATAVVESGANFAETSVPACDWTITAKSIAGSSVVLGDRLVHTGSPLTQSVVGVTTADGFLLTPADYVVSGNTATDVGQYTLTVTGKGNFTGTATAQYTIYSTAGSELKDQVGDIGEVVPDENGGWKVVITNDIADTTIEINDNLGNVTIDLKGRNVIGKAGSTGDAVGVAGGNGEPAIRIVASGASGDATVLTVVDSVPDDTDDVIGGRGGDGTPGGNGGAAIQVVGGTKAGVKINIGASVGVRGGDGGKDLSGNSRGGDGGAGVDGNVGTNDGTIAGGDGGESENGRGGDGGAGVTGSVEVNNGEISGGEGGSSEHGRGGSGGQGVEGTIGGGPGSVTDGENGSEPTIVIVDGGKSGSLNEASIEVPYDGKGHGIKITVTEPAEGALVEYALSAEGPFSPVNPLFTNVVDHAAVWYVVSAEGYVAVTNWATVTIYPSAQKRFRVTYNYNGGSGGPEFGDFDIATYYGTSLPEPRKQGYLFAGWYESPDFSGKPVGRNTEVITADITLYAKWNARALWYADSAFHIESASVWDGYVLAADESAAGTVQVKVGKPNKKTGICKVSAIVQLAGEKKQTLKGTTFDGSLALVAKDGRKLDLQLYENGMVGTFAGNAVDGARNIFKAKDADSKVRAAQALKLWQGSYVAVIKAPDGCYGGLSVTVKSKGAVKVAGSLADGAKVSGKSQLLVGERECAIAFSWTKKSSTVSFLMWLCEDGSVEISNLNDPRCEATAANQKSGAYLASGAALRLDASAVVSSLGSATLAELLPDGEPVVQSGAKWTVAKAGKVKLADGEVVAGANPSALKLTYKLKDSTFKGSFTAYQLAGGKLKKVKLAVTGVVLGGKGYGTATVKKPAANFPITIE